MRRRRTVAALGALFALGALAPLGTAAERPSAVRTPLAPATDIDALGIRVGADGWITYAHTLAASLPLRGARMRTVAGRVDRSGGCRVQSSRRELLGRGWYEEDVAFNPATCRRKVLVARLDPARKAVRDALVVGDQDQRRAVGRQAVQHRQYLTA